ncbi:hypothetical protein N619_01185 [Ectopseudomonas oleovorans]|nr:hypothetical protein N619_01185 [Pseudomonas oleovorans]
MSENVKTMFANVSPEGVAKPAIIKILESALEEARAGRLESIAIAYTRFDGNTVTNWENTQGSLKAIGAVSHLLHRMNRELAQ